MNRERSRKEFALRPKKSALDDFNKEFLHEYDSKPNMTLSSVIEICARHRENFMEVVETPDLITDLGGGDEQIHGRATRTIWEKLGENSGSRESRITADTAAETYAKVGNNPRHPHATSIPPDKS